jgi:translation initiation factor 2B subunit (eIF-2B alpha/beta/delta family)
MSIDMGGKAANIASLQMLESARALWPVSSLTALRRIEKASSDRVRRHLEQQVKEMGAIIQAANSPNFSSKEAQRRLDKENASLQDLLRQEAAARKEAEAARLQGSDALHSYQYVLGYFPLALF